MSCKDFDYINTKKLALLLGGLQPESIHRSLCVRGHYLGLVPIKLGNGRLLWSMDDVIKTINKITH